MEAPTISGLPTMLRQLQPLAMCSTRMPVGQTQYAWSAGANSYHPAAPAAIVNCAVAPGGINGSSFWVKATAGTSTVIDGSAISNGPISRANGRNATRLLPPMQHNVF